MFQSTRPVLVPKAGLPLRAGYAEAVNGGKTTRNEDQAAARVLHLVEQSYAPDANTATTASVPTPCPGRK